MPDLTIDGDLVALAPGHRLGDGPRRIELIAALIKLHEFEICPEPDRASVRCQLPDQHLEQRRLAGAVRADKAEAIATHQPNAGIGYYGVALERLRNADGLDDEFARGRTFRRGHRHVAGDLAGLALLLPHLREQRDTANIALAPAGDAAVHPLLFARDFAIELMRFELLFLQHLVAPRFEHAEALLVAPGDTAVEPYGRLRKVFQEPAVVADQNDRRPQVPQFLLEPFDRGQIEMVRRLVEQQNVGTRRQYVGQRGATRLTTRNVRWIFLAS